MKNLQKLVAVLMAVLVVLCGALLLTHDVSAASEGKISGTVKYEGTPPHMRGIDMSKDPYCAKANASTSPHMENVVVGSGGGLENVVLYISEGLSGPALSQPATNVPVFDQKNCGYTPHVLAIDVGQNINVSTINQTVLLLYHM